MRWTSVGEAARGITTPPAWPRRGGGRCTPGRGRRRHPRGRRRRTGNQDHARLAPDHWKRAVRWVIARGLEKKDLPMRHLLYFTPLIAAAGTAAAIFVSP